MEDNMLSRFVSGGLLGALAGAAMLVVASGPSSAFTLSSPSLERPVATAGIQKVYYYYRRYYRRPYYHHLLSAVLSSSLLPSLLSAVLSPLLPSALFLLGNSVIDSVALF